MALDQSGATAPDVACFVAKESDAPDVVLQLLLGSTRIIGRSPVAPKQAFSDDVDLFVCALSRKNGGYEELQWGLVVEFASRLWVSVRQCPQQGLYSRF